VSIPNPFKRADTETAVVAVTYDKRTLQNQLLMYTLLRHYPNVDISLIDPTWEYREAVNYLKQRYPKLMVKEPKKGELLSVNSIYMHIADLTDSRQRYYCEYCGEAFIAERSTKKYCSDGHRVMMHYKRNGRRKSSSGKRPSRRSRRN
jgi:hypothetical protein